MRRRGRWKVKLVGDHDRTVVVVLGVLERRAMATTGYNNNEGTNVDVEPSALASHLSLLFSSRQLRYAVGILRKDGNHHRWGGELVKAFRASRRVMIMESKEYEWKTRRLGMDSFKKARVLNFCAWKYELMWICGGYGVHRMRKVLKTCTRESEGHKVNMYNTMES